MVYLLSSGLMNGYNRKDCWTFWAPRGPSLLVSTEAKKSCISGQWKCVELSTLARGPIHRGLEDKIKASLVPRLELGDDVVLWKHGEGEYKDLFSASSTWEQIQRRRTHVQWNKLIWFSQGVPPCGFITWFAVKNRLSTGDRMWSWSVKLLISPVCFVESGMKPEITYSLPARIRILFGSISWVNFWDLPSTRTGRTCYSASLFISLQIWIISFSAYSFRLLFTIWREINARRHGTSQITVSAMKHIIHKMMRNRIVSMWYHYPHKLEGLLRRWFEMGGTVWGMSFLFAFILYFFYFTSV